MDFFGQYYGEDPANWRHSNTLPTEKLEYLLESGTFSDMTALVGKSAEKFPCHKFVLVLSSSVFENIIYKQINNHVIEIPDILPDAFQYVLKYIYTGKLEELSSKTLVDILIAAHKYDIMDLVDLCKEKLRNGINETNAVTILQTSERICDLELMHQAEILIRKKFSKIIEEDDFLNLSHENLCKYFESDNTNIPCELKLFEAAMKWAKAKCYHLEMEPRPENQRKILNQVLHLIRFPLMAVKQFASKVVPKNILTPEECVALFQHMTLSGEEKLNIPNISFNSHQRAGHTLPAFTVEFVDQTGSCSRHNSVVSVKCCNTWSHNLLMVDHNISLQRLGFFGPCDDVEAEYEVELRVEDCTTNQLLGNVTEIITNVTQEIFHVQFTEKILLCKNCWYKVSFKLKGPDTLATLVPKKTFEAVCGMNTVTFNLDQWDSQLPEISFNIEF